MSVYMQLFLLREFAYFNQYLDDFLCNRESLANDLSTNSEMILDKRSSLQRTRSRFEVCF